ncbi:MAG: bifunctional pyr operon transcriptional regulator/uracil phosphoribosyltransferase PyrR [Spirosomataceae bacterium]|jgi:pyrimidine operon attenuation protein/uracil phosphoribosyltransferase
MQQKRLILNQNLIDITIQRLCQELIENHGEFSDTVLLGLQPRGIYLADKIGEQLALILQKKIPLGYIDATFYRDDFRRRASPLTPNATRVPFIIENKQVILIDDVISSGRMVRAAMDAMQAFGRPSRVELLCLIDRKYNRDIPIQPDYIGQKVNTLDSQLVSVEWKVQGCANDAIWLVE